MGNEGSMLPGLDIDSKSVENTEEWTLHSATSSSSASPNLSVFCGRQANHINSNNSFEHAIKNFRIYRHPNILKYISSWTHQGQLCMATESVSPLSTVIENQTVFEICLGLHDILKAIIFLHEKALCSHNNICCASIYVTNDGSWKLGGLEFLSRFSELTPDFLQKARARRYEKAVPPEEDAGKAIDPKSIDSFAFGVLVEDVFCRIPDDVEVSGIKEFREIAKKQLQSLEPSLRPKLSQLLIQPIFNHRFVIIHDFLSELPLKSDDEKASFFRGLVDQLREFPEVLLASQLSALLLSRLVLLDKTAQEHLLPLVLRPQNPNCIQDKGDLPLFSMNIFQQYVVPRLLHIFSVRDAQVRLLLLEHFEHYCCAFNKDQLCAKVLPELLVGIKDTSDTIVASTLRALAILIPILGSSIVIGGKRARLFTDGRPNISGIIHKSQPLTSLIEEERQHIKEQVTIKNSIAQEAALPLSITELPERPSPDGGEDLALTAQLDEETDNWSDWDVNEAQASSGIDEFNEMTVLGSLVSEEHFAENISAPLSLAQTPAVITASRNHLPDLTSLDIKNSGVAPRKQSVAEEIDFFQDMEPVISKPKLLPLNTLDSLVDSTASNVNLSCFDVDITTNGLTEGEAWGDNEDWGDISDTDIS